MEPLVLRRIALERQRVFGIVWLCSGVGFFVLGVLLAVSDPNVGFAVLRMVAGLGWIAWGVVLLREAARDKRAFEREFGVDAGRQPPR